MLNRPTALIDPNGEWWTPIHVDILDVALSGILAPGDLALLERRQYVMDSNQSDQTGHFMASPNQELEQAKQNSMNFIAKNLQAAAGSVDASGKMSGIGLADLGDAIHTIQDMTSPMHTSDDGTPKVWYGEGHTVSIGLPHWLGENAPSDNWARFGWAVKLTLAAYVQTNPIDAAEHGLNANNYEKEANRRIEDYVTSFYLISGESPGAQDAARQCALGNPAACVN